MQEDPKGPVARILICEDELLLAADLERTLENLGYEVAGSVSTGEQAVQEAENAKPDLILMDIKLAGRLGGIEAAERIRARFDIPVVYLPGYPEKDVLQRAKKTEPYGYLSKPVGMLELRSTVETALYKHAADKRVRASEERLRLVMEATSDGVWDWDLATGHTYYSPGYFSMLDFEPGQFPDHISTWLDLMHPDDRDLAWEVNQDCIHGRTEAFAIEFRMQHKDGSWRWILGRGKCVARNDQGAALRLVGTHTDITDRKRAEDALRNSEERFRTIFEKAPIMINCFSPHGEVLLWNHELERTLGWTKEEARAGDILALCYPDPAVREQIKGNISRADGRFRECTPSAKDGSLRTQMWADFRLPDGNAIAVGLDITGKKLAEKALLENFSIIENLVEKAADGFAVCHNIDEEPYVRFTHWNPRMTELTGYTIEEINRTGWYQTMYPDPEVRQRAIGRMARMRVGDDLRGEEWEVTTKEGRKAVLSISTSVVSEEIDKAHVLAIMRDVTEKRNTLRELARAKDDWEQTFNTVRDLVMILDDQQRIVRLNRAATEAFGLSMEEAVGTFCFKSVHGADERPPLCPFEKMAGDLSEHSEEVFEERFQRTFDVTVSPIFDANCNLSGCVHVARDITERKKQEEALKESEHKYRLLVENVKEAVYVIQDGMIKFVNHHALMQSGHSEAEILSKHFLKFVFPDDRERVMGYHLSRLRGEDAPSRYSFRVTGAQGNIIWLEANPVPITWEGEPAFMSFAVNITDRKLAEDQLRAALAQKEIIEQQLKQSEQRFREIASLVPQFIYEIDLEGRFTFLNQAAIDSTGYSTDDFNADVSFGDVFNATDHERMMENLAKILRGEKSKGNEYHCIRKDGTAFPILAYSSPIIREATAIGVRGVAVDITDLKRAEEQIKAALDEKEVLLREIHHRVKNNLAIISSLIRLQSGHADEIHRGMFEECRGRIRSMALAHELLYQSDNVAIIRATEYLGSLARHVSRYIHTVGTPVDFRTEIEDISLDLDTAIPLGLIATELISNGLKHAFVGRRAGEIHISLRSTGEQEFELIVRDNGVGIPEDIDFKGPRSIGLDLVDIFARQLHGRVEIVRDRGTLVRVGFRAPCYRK